MSARSMFRKSRIEIEAQTVLERRVESHVHRFDRAGERDRPVLEHGRGHGARGPEECIGLDDRVGEPETRGLRAVDRVAGEDQLQRRATADEPRETLRAAVSRNEPELHFGEPELRLRGRHANVAREREFASPAEGEAVHGGDDGLRREFDAAEHRLSESRELLEVAGRRGCEP